MNIPPVRWLHLSDFHVGKDGAAHRQLFKYILEHVEQKKNEDDFVPDFLFLTGDLANWGLESEYKVFWEEFAQPLQQLIGGDIASRTFVVPGNHDVNRKKNPAFDRGEIAREADYFHANANGQELRSILLPRFEAFRAADRTLDQGAIFSAAGAFGRLVPWHGYQVGIAGINTAWLCKDEQDEKQLTPGKALLEKVLAQIDAADLRIVLGHHPVDWLLPDQQRPIKAVLGKAEVLYLHGHLHEQWLEPTHGGGGEFLAIQTGAAFQAEEHEVWRNGLLWGEADLAAHKLRLQPYEWSRNHQKWVLKGDAFHPNFKDRLRPDWWAYSLPGNPVPKLIAQPTIVDDPSAVASVPNLTRPLLKPLPPDSWADIEPRFIGRVLPLSDVADAVAGLRARAVGASPATGGQAVKLIWVHGFGGMGKSWFLHRARQQAEATSAVRTLIVEWDRPEWRVPLKGEPLIAEDIFEVLAYRLAQVLGPAVAEPYWQADDQVTAASTERQRLRNKFGNELRAAHEGRDSELSEETRRLLRSQNLWDGDITQRRQNMARWWNQPIHYEVGFAAWCRAGSHSFEAAIIEPDSLRADALRTALQQAAAKYPLLVLLDTGEVLSEEIDNWLRQLLAPLLRDETPILLLIGNRKQPDIDQPKGSREGWRTELRGRIREIDFAEAKRFTVEEIEEALNGLQTPPTGNYAGLAERLHRLTLGVPLAVRTLLDLHEEGDELLFSLAEIFDENEADLSDDGQAVQKVIEAMVSRLLYHLVRRPQATNDLRDIVALGLLQRVDSEVLQAFWNTSVAGVRARLRQLGNQYALLSGNDLHGTVRGYLRRHWRHEENRPADFEVVLAQLQVALGSPSNLPIGSPESINQSTQHLNLLAWRQQGPAVLQVAAQLLAVALAYEVNTEAIEDLLRELPLAGAARRLWQAIKPPSRIAIIGWLQSLPTLSWTAIEKGCLALITGLARLEEEWWEIEQADALAAFPFLEAAVAEFSVTPLPQAELVGQAYFRVARSLQDENGSSKWPKVVEQALRRAISFGAEKEKCYNGLGYLLASQMGRELEAEQYYKTVLAIDPDYDNALNGLGSLLADQVGREADAERYYRQVLSIDSQNKDAYKGLAFLLSSQPSRMAEAEALYREIIQFDPSDGSGHRGLAWLLLIKTADTAMARIHVIKAKELDNSHPSIALSEIGLATWETNWVAVQLKLVQLLDSSPNWLFSSADFRLIALFRKIKEQGGLTELASLLHKVADDAKPWWQPWHEAVAALEAGLGIDACTTNLTRTIYQQLVR